ncbi:hypothetical protein TWF569_009476 [Orbilia oligospora]|uniref:Uncharacterized protein n=1 Tax=Orbilia oligospora TaxID=2813651 RepID=A0A7C8NIF9_ORBOL|nr:hypothetical protein TWF103_002245 [Orbilia oligospora]KAF3087466.1 hypothetical protein TWF102_010531 [Orbilia oligospora]KAF3136487.1 hypothetical protein TWF569_009476 [Orbilia oligospora]KAF3152980.1 hypothetical protein TWF594_000031 [Orbilia oligospora]
MLTNDMHSFASLLAGRKYALESHGQDTSAGAPNMHSGVGFCWFALILAIPKRTSTNINPTRKGFFFLQHDRERERKKKKKPCLVGKPTALGIQVFARHSNVPQTRVASKSRHFLRG